jgi:hypothetical protein
MNVVSQETSPSPQGWGIEGPGGAIENKGYAGRPNMVHLDGYRIKVHYKGLEGLSEIGFKLRQVQLDKLFPTADELIVSAKAYFQRLDGAASLLYEVPDVRFGVAESHGLLELAVADHQGDYTGLIIDVLAPDTANAHLMMDDIEKTCGFVRAKFADALGIMVMSEDDYMQGLRESMRLLASELRR